jgi:propionyl-CoA synthetase
MAKITDSEKFRRPATIDDPTVLEEIRAAVRGLGYGG